MPKIGVQKMPLLQLAIKIKKMLLGKNVTKRPFRQPPVVTKWTKGGSNLVSLSGKRKNALSSAQE
jgi:hypothetical protein